MVDKNDHLTEKQSTIRSKECDSEGKEDAAGPTTREKTRGKQSTVSLAAQNLVESAAPQRPQRNTKATVCVKCSNLVRAKDDGLQCDICARWEHLECSPVSVRLHGYLQAERCRQIIYVCSNCTELRKKGQALILHAFNHNATTPVRSIIQPACNNTGTSGLPSEVTIPSSAPTHAEENATSTSESSDSENTIIEACTRKPVKRRRTRRPKPKSQGLSDQPSTVNTTEADEGNDWITVQAANPKRSTIRDPAEQQIEAKSLRFPPRDRCLMVFRLPESESPNPSDRYDEDMKLLSGVVSKLLDSGEDVTVKRIIRIGKRSEGNLAPRPLKLVFNSTSEAKLLLSRSHRLRDSPWSLRPDLSPEEREKQREAVQCLRERLTQGETNLVIRNFQVVRKRLHKRPVTLRAQP